MLAESAIPGSTLWPLLLGSAITLVSTLVAQWASLIYQSKLRRADFQRTNLLRLRDTLEELGEPLQAVVIARVEALEADDDSPLSLTHPKVLAVWDVTSRMRLLAEGVDDKPLRLATHEYAERASNLAAYEATHEEWDEGWMKEWERMNSEHHVLVLLLGKQLRRLP